MGSNPISATTAPVPRDSHPGHFLSSNRSSELCQIREVYFVADGKHRVPVARANGFGAIDAYVTMIEPGWR